MTRLAVAWTILASTAFAADPTRILPPGERPSDRRLTDKPRDLNGYFPFDPPATKAAWEARRKELREHLLVSLGLWPLPEHGKVEATVYGKIERDGYTVEKVFFASLPGHYVTGNLYRPSAAGKHPVVLCPHGHWSNGRFYDAGEKEAKAQIASGGETWPESARYPLQARCAHLARMGCVVFHYDMVGYADSNAIVHREGFADADATLRLHSQMGLQTWNSIRALDFALGMPSVDATRVGLTGASGGGTQSFILAALDDRVTCCVPAVMVSTAMQGGCVCENAPYLRLGTGNVEFAAMFAPKPLALIGAKDWTIDIETKGYPQLQALYRLYETEGKVLAKCFPQFGHNYNQVSREVTYAWFNKHLNLGQAELVKERPFVPVQPRELSVFDAEHPRPADAADAAGVRRVLTDRDRSQLEAILPTDAAKLAKFRRITGVAVREMIHDSLPVAGTVTVDDAGPKEEADGRTARKLWLSRKGSSERLPTYGVRGTKFDGDVVVWVHPAGKSSLFVDGKPTPELEALLDGGSAVVGIDLIGTGELSGVSPSVDAKYAGFTFGYNRPFFAEQVHDVLTAVRAALDHPSAKRVHLVGWGSAGPVALTARSLCGDAIGRTAVDLDGFRFDDVRTNGDPRMLPGALKYGGVGGIAALCAPHELYLANHRGTGTGQIIQAAYKAAGADAKLRREPERPAGRQVIEWLLKPTDR